MGRKGLYERKVEPHLKEISELYGLMTEAQIAKKLGVGISSWTRYKRDHEELRNALEQGREGLIIDLKKTLKKKAKGFHYKERKKTIRETADGQVIVIEEFERYALPDTGAIHLLLKNLDPAWRNDDQTTVDMKRERLELEKEKADASVW